MRKTANLAARKDNLRNLEETFTYDHLNRLTDVWLNNAHTGHMAYDALGRMTDKRTDGQNVFSAAQHDYVGPDGQLRPHAISSATVEGNPFPTAQQSITYTMFDKVKTITQSDNWQQMSLSYAYGYDHQRTMMYETASSVTCLKHYVGNCEFVIRQGIQKKLTYLSGPMGVFAVVEKKNGEENMYYVLKDHLGSWTMITDDRGYVKREQSFDAWGIMRDPYTWTGNTVLLPMFDRGYTGHEHLNSFGLINMNGRMYDPIMSSFLSVDNYVQAPDFSQSFNRYAYCWNNPLRYVDPDGEAALTTLAIVGIGIATVMGGYTGYRIAESKGYGFSDWQTYGYMLGGAAVGFAAGYTGAYLAAGGGFMANTGAILCSSWVNYSGMTMLSGGSYSPPISFGAVSYDPMNNEWGYLFKDGNSWVQNLGYGFGALANLQDIVAGVNGGSYQYQYEKEKGNIGHANIRQVSYDSEGNVITNVKISVANKYPINAWNNLDWVWKSNFKKYTGGGELWLDVPEQGWERIPLQLNTKIVDWMYRNLENGKGLWGITETRFGINYGCVSYAARALWTAGVPTIPIINYLGPSVLWMQLAIRQLGIQVSPFIIDCLGKKHEP